MHVQHVQHSSLFTYVHIVSHIYHMYSCSTKAHNFIMFIKFICSFSFFQKYNSNNTYTSKYTYLLFPATYITNIINKSKHFVHYHHLLFPLPFVYNLTLYENFQNNLLYIMAYDNLHTNRKFSSFLQPGNLLQTKHLLVGFFLFLTSPAGMLLKKCLSLNRLLLWSSTWYLPNVLLSTEGSGILYDFNPSWIKYLH